MSPELRVERAGAHHCLLLLDRPRALEMSPELGIIAKQVDQAPEHQKERPDPKPCAKSDGRPQTPRRRA